MYLGGAVIPIRGAPLTTGDRVVSTFAVDIHLEEEVTVIREYDYF